MGIIGNLRISPTSSQSTVLDATFETPEPEKGKDILASLFKFYNREEIIDKTQTAAKTLAFIDDRLGLVTSQLDSVERNIANYKSRERIVDVSSQGQLFLQNVQVLDNQNSQVGLQLEVLNSVDNYVRNKGGKQGTVPSISMINDPMLGGLLTRLYDAEFQLDKIKSVSGEKSDAVLLAESDVNRLKKDIRENMGNIRNNLVNQRNAIASNINKSSGLLSQVPQKERGFLEISRQQGIRNSIYTYLLQKREETALSSASTIADLKVIEDPYFYGPIKPVAKSFYLAGLPTYF